MRETYNWQHRWPEKVRFNTDCQYELLDMIKLFFESQCKREQSQACLNSAECSLTSIFYQIIQVAIGTRTELSRTLSDTEWRSVYEMAKKQALVGICFVGCQKTLSSSPLKGEDSINHTPYTINLPEVLRLQWMGMAAKIQQRNEVLNEESRKVCAMFEQEGFKAFVLKGQGNLLYYPDDLGILRQPGDIDVWVKHKDGIPVVVRYVHKLLRDKGMKKMPELRYHHVDCPISDVTGVEVHVRPIYMCNPLYNSRMQRYFYWYNRPVVSDIGLPMGGVEFNVVYQLAHIYHHLFEEGIGLRQLMDYYFVLKNTPPTPLHRRDLLVTLRQFGLARLASAVMYVLAHVFEPNDDDNPSLREPQGKLCSGQALNDNWASRWSWMICEPDERLGKHLLEEIMRAGNFGKYDERIARDYGLRIMGHGFNLPIGLVRAIEKTKRNLLLARYYPGEALWEPPFRLYHFFWRKLELWK